MDLDNSIKTMQNLPRAMSIKDGGHVSNLQVLLLSGSVLVCADRRMPCQPCV